MAVRKGNDCHDVKIRHTPTAMIVIVWRDREGMKVEEMKRNIRGKERRDRTSVMRHSLTSLKAKVSSRRCIGEEGYDCQDLSDVTDHDII